MSSPSPNDLTRQQLDELDTLLQRMLGLPLAPPPDAVPARRPPEPLPLPEPAVRPPAGWRADAPVTAARPPFVTAPASVPLAPAADPEPVARFTPPEPVPVRAFAPPTADTGVPPSTGDWLGRGPLVAPGTLRGVDAPALPTGFAAPPTDEAPAEAEPAVLVPAPETPDAPAVTGSPSLPLALWPLAAANWVLETAFGLLGPVGTALTRPAGKNALAVAGGVLLVAAAAWTARGLGWVQLPLPR
ncbi:MAG: hypothetical protein U0871_16575 [Gemmataceae bacterium]